MATNKPDVLGRAPLKPYAELVTKPARTRGRPSGSTSARTRAKLLRAAREVFAEQGYAGASTAEIVARAGVSAPVLYHHFSSKAGVFAAATAAVYDDVISHLEATVTGHDSFAECVDAILSASVQMHVDDPSMARFIVSTPLVVAGHPELAAVREEFRRTEKLFTRIVADTGGIDGFSAIESIRVLRMLVWGMTRLSASLPDARDFGPAVDALRAVLLHGALSGLRPPDPSVPLS
jgi:AcrR family transcriptional regulator